MPAGKALHTATGSLDLKLTKQAENVSSKRPTYPWGHLSGATGGCTLLADTILTVKEPVPGHVGARLPREAERGGGQIVLSNRTLLEAVKDEMESFAKSESRRPDNDSPGTAGLSRTRSAAERGGSATLDTPRSSVGIGKGPGAKVTQEERKRAEIFSKWQKTEDMRQMDRKVILERVERGQEWREDRFKRLLNAVTGRDNLAYKTALALREREAHEDRRKRELHDHWSQKVHEPLADQAENFMNPPNRAHHQRMMGSKSVDFTMPGHVNRLVANITEDPTRKQLVDHARENAFHQAATSVLSASSSAPDLRRMSLTATMGGPPPFAQVGGGSLLAKATSRPVLEPSSWGQRDIQGTMFGHFAQVAEFGPGFRRALRGGTNVHIPDGSDMVLASGTRRSRTEGHGDVGILRGETAAQGETSVHKTPHGASSGAPAQDHYTFETGKHVTDIEFPLGKRRFPQFN